MVGFTKRQLGLLRLDPRILITKQHVYYGGLRIPSIVEIRKMREKERNKKGGIVKRIPHSFLKA